MVQKVIGDNTLSIHSSFHFILYSTYGGMGNYNKISSNFTSDHVVRIIKGSILDIINQCPKPHPQWSVLFCV